MKRTEQDMYAEVFRKWTNEVEENTSIPPESYRYDRVKRGLRNSDGTGVLAGLTKVCQVHGYVMYEDEKLPDAGKLIYRGVDVSEIVGACEAENRFGYEETCYLLLFGKLPTTSELAEFRNSFDPDEMVADINALIEG